MNRVLIDTDVILDFFFDRQPFSADAAQILSYCERRAIEGFITPVIVSNVYYLLRKVSKHDKIVASLSKLLEILDIAGINKAAIVNALNSDFKDFEDALQNFAAIGERDISVIITRNIKDYKASSLAVMTPETYLKTISS